MFLLIDDGVLVTFEIDENRKETEIATAVAIERLFHTVVLFGFAAYFLYIRAVRNRVRA